MNTSSPALEILNGREIADHLYESELQSAKTIGDVRGKLDTLMQTVGANGDAGRRLTEIKTSVDHASEGGKHDDLQLKDDLGSGVLGMNKIGTRESVMRRDQFSPDQVVNTTRHTLDTVLHEHSEELGHAGQDSRAAATLTVIDASGQMRDSTTVIEGNVVANVSARLGGRREGLPQETYLEGADLVDGLGRETVDSYVRKGGANVGKHLQEEVWRQNTGIELDEMLAQGAAVGMTEDQVIRVAREQGKLPKDSLTPALAA